MINGSDRFLHTLFIGPTGCGKSSTGLKPLIYQDLKSIKKAKENGQTMSITLVEPKGDLAQDVSEMARAMDVPVVHIDPENPYTSKINILEGEDYVVAEVVRTILRSLFGRQEAFFAQIQETLARNTVLLLKGIYGNNVTLVDLVRTLRDSDTLRCRVNEYADSLMCNEDLLEYFEREVLSKKADKFRELTMGLRQQIEDIVGNPLIRNVIDGRSTISLNDHLENPGILITNTAMGKLGKLGDVFGKFIVHNLINAVFQRQGNEFTRSPHFLYIDEFPRYISPDFERLLAIGRSYRCGCVLAAQGTDQFEISEMKGLKNIILSSTRNKVIFGGLTYKDAEFFSREMGMEKKEITTCSTVEDDLGNTKTTITTSKKDAYRYSIADFQEMPAFHVIYKLVNDGHPQQPGTGLTKFVELSDEEKEKINSLREMVKVESVIDTPQKNVYTLNAGPRYDIKPNRRQSNFSTIVSGWDDFDWDEFERDQEKFEREEFERAKSEMLQRI